MGDAKETAKIFTREFVLINAINMLFTLGFQGMTPAMPLYLDSLGATAFQLGMSTTITTTASLVVRAFVGAVLDRFGRRGVLFVSMLVTVIAMLGIATVPVVSVVLIFRGLQGVGLGLGTTATSTIAADIIPKSRFAEAIGYFALTSALAGAIGPALAIEVTERFDGATMVWIMLGSAVISFLLSLFYRTQGPKNDVPVDDAPETETSDGAEKKVNAKGLAVFFEKRALLPTLSMMLVCTGFSSLLSFIAVHAASRGLTGMSVYFLCYALTSAVTRPFVGKLVDRIGWRLPGTIACVLVAVTLSIVSVADSIVLICIGGVICGAGMGTCMTSFQTMAVSAVPANRRGVATSTFLFGFDLGIAMGSLIAGALLSFMTTTTMFLAMTAFPILGGIAMFVGCGRIDKAAAAAEAGAAVADSK